MSIPDNARIVLPDGNMPEIAIAGVGMGRSLFCAPNTDGNWGAHRLIEDPDKFFYGIELLPGMVEVITTRKVPCPRFFRCQMCPLD